jgi:hypothetical protein
MSISTGRVRQRRSTLQFRDASRTLSVYAMNAVVYSTDSAASSTCGMFSWGCSAAALNSRPGTGKKHKYIDLRGEPIECAISSQFSP